MNKGHIVPQFDPTVQWLLESRTPSIRYLAMRHLLDLPEEDEQVLKARQAIALEPPGSAILKAQRPEGYWEQTRSVYSPKYKSSHWSMLLLSELGIDPYNENIQKGAEYMLGIRERNPPWYLMRQQAGFGCFWGNWLRYEVYCGKAEDSRVQEVIGFVCADLQRRGKCRYNSELPCAWAVVRELFGLALLPAEKRGKEIQNAINAGIHFLLDEYDVLKANYPADNKPHELWNSLSFPLYYHADVLLILRILKELNSLHHPNAQPAMDWLRAKQQKDGTWHGGSPFKLRSRPFLKAPDEVDRWITLQALTILK